MVMAVFDKAFDIFILRLGVTKRVYCDVSFQDKSGVQDFEADFPQKVSLKMLN